MLLEDIPQNEDRAKLVKGSNLSVLRQSKKVEHWSQGGGAGFLRGPWSKEAYTGDGKYTSVGPPSHFVELRLMSDVAGIAGLTESKAPCTVPIRIRTALTSDRMLPRNCLSTS